jgi:Flp pilus assembly protein TadG
MMMQNSRRRRPETSRSGKTLVLFALGMPMLMGMTGLVIDSGLLMAGQRSVQNAADAGALSAAMELYRGSSSSTATSTATTFVQTYNGFTNATVTVNTPPSSGPYSGNSSYVEAIVSVPFTTSFIQALGINSSQTVAARAVAGFEPIAAGQGAIVLRPDIQPGITLNGNNTRLIVNGGITDNSRGGGVDQYGQAVSSTLGGYGFRTQTSTQSPAPVVALAIQVAGGIDTLDNFRVYDSGLSPNFYDPSNTDRPVFANLQTTAPDPLLSMATPTTSNGVVNTFWQYQGSGQWTTASSAQKVTIGNSDTVTFSPGIYKQIILNGGNVTFNPGIYVLGPGLGNGNGQQTLSISNGATVNGSGVMFYNTGSDYQSSGTPDSSDGNTLGTDSSANFGSIAVNGGNINLSPISSSSSPFYGILFYQRRWNTQDFSVGGNSDTVNLSGTVYDKWGNLTLAGQGQYNAEFVVGSMSISGGAAVTINATGKNQGRVNQVFLVE